MVSDLLIVDDDPFIRKLVTTTLRNVGAFRLHEAADGAEAVEVSEALRLGMALLDVDMPELDGIETCRRLRELHGSEPVIVMLTGSEDAGVEERAMEAGADRFLTKPFSPIELLELVAELGGDEGDDEPPPAA
jgi:two-component system chemotaxis response regulator CheY